MNDLSEYTYKCGDLTVNRFSRVATINGDEVSLTAYEFNLLHYLITRQDQVVFKRDIARQIGKDDYFSKIHTIDVHLSNLRRKLRNSSSVIRTIHGIGVRLQS